MREVRERHTRVELQMNRSKYQEDYERNLSTRLYVGNLDYNTTISQFRETFGRYGEIVSIDLKSGYAFVVRNSLIFFNFPSLGVRQGGNC